MTKWQKRMTNTFCCVTKPEIDSKMTFVV